MSQSLLGHVALFETVFSLVAAVVLTSAEPAMADTPHTSNDPASAASGAPRLSEAAAICIALGEAHRVHLNLAEYDPPTASFKPNSVGGYLARLFSRQKCGS